MDGLGSGEWMPTTVAADAAVLVYSSILEAHGMGVIGEGEREGWPGWDLGSGCRQQLQQTQLFSSIFRFCRPWDGRDRGRGARRMGGLGSVERMPTTFVAVAADAAVLVYLSISEAPGIRGSGEREREGWSGWDLCSGCRQLLRMQLFSSIFQFWRPLGWEGEGRGRGKDGWVGSWGVGIA